jgi:cytochrome c553
MKELVVAAVCGMVGLSGAVYAAGDAATGKAKSAVCAGCHGADGNSTIPMYPRLAGQHEQYLVTALKEFKAGTRSNPIMKPMATPLSDQDIENLAAYFSSQPCK